MNIKSTRTVNAAAPRRAPDADVRRSRAYYVVCAALIFCSLCMHVQRIAQIGFTTHDDIGLDMSAAAVRAGGFRAYFTQAYPVAAEQGRIGMLESWFFGMAPYLVSAGARPFLIAGLHFLSLGALSAYVGVYLGWDAAWLAFGLLYAFLPHYWRHFPIAAYPIGFHVPIFLFFAGLLLYLWSVRRAPGLAARVAAQVLAGTFIFISLGIYESLTLAFYVVVFATILAERRPDPRGGLWASARRALPLLIPCAVYIPAYLTFRILHPPVYSGTQLSSRGVATLGSMIKDVSIYVLGGIPGAAWLLQRNIIREFSVGTIQGGWLSFIGNNLHLDVLLQAALACCAVVLAVRGAGQGLARTRCWRIALCAVVIAVAVEIPQSLTGKYVDALAWTPYVSGYFTYLALVIAFATVVLLLRGWRRRLGRLAVVATAAGTLFVVALTGMADDAIVRSQALHYATWKLVDAWMKTDQFRGIPEKSVIIAPILWSDLAPGWSMYPDYWRQYVLAHGGRDIHFVRDVPDALYRDPARRNYYLTIQRSRDDTDPVLVLSELDPGSASPASPPSSHRVFLLSEAEIKDTVLLFSPVSPNGNADPQGSQGFRTAPVPDFRKAGGGFAASVVLPTPMAVGSAYLESSWGVASNLFDSRNLAAVRLELGRGFYGIESDDSHVWEWTDTRIGEAVIQLHNRTASAVTGRLSFQFLTGRPQRVPVAVEGPGIHETLAVTDGDHFERQLILCPGPSEIRFRFHLDRLAVPDTRDLGFAVRDWKMSVEQGNPASLPSACPSPPLSTAARAGR